ncbi:MAG TPA: hypothetical protein VM658_06630 [bacterium]|nr:hypothetical protein [bacterium]
MDTKQIQQLALVLLGAAVLHLFIAIGFLWSRNHMGGGQDQTIATLKDQWREEDAERRSEQEDELQSKYGTTKIDRIAFDPRMDIKLVLEKLCRAVMPNEYDIRVTVDRFTEFRIFVNTYNMPQTNVLAGYLKDIFSRVDPRYVYQVTFTDEDNFWIIDQAQLLRVGDWKSAGDDEIKKYCFPVSPFK